MQDSKLITEKLVTYLPKDELHIKRLNALKRCVGLAYSEEGLVFVNKRFGFLNNMTWVTKPEHRNKGVATSLARSLVNRFSYMTVKTRNEASRKVAQRCGFKEVIRNYWVYFNNVMA